MAKIPTEVFQVMRDQLAVVRQIPGVSVISRYDDIRNMSKNQLRNFYYQNKAKAYALLEQSNNKDMLLSSKVT